MPDFLGSRAIWGRDSALSHRNVIRRRLDRRGFTIIELVVVTAIIAIITGLILVSDSRFGGVVLLENLAYDMALSIRQAQVYGISVQRFTTGTNTYTFAAGYGVHLDTSSQFNYLTFADACVNGLYDTAGGTCPSGEVVSTTQLDRGFRIYQLCATTAGVESCAYTKLDILFVRPEPDALISVPPLSCTQSPANCYTRARIVVASPRGDLKSIIVEQNGQITVK